MGSEARTGDLGNCSDVVRSLWSEREMGDLEVKRRAFVCLFGIYYSRLNRIPRLMRGEKTRYKWGKTAWSLIR